jgi:hypothetical protein
MINRIIEICAELNVKGARIIPWFSTEGCRIENIFGEKLTEFMSLDETIEWLNKNEGILNLK